jgi:phage shock protein PspC (stress-responsive transcriptional regulator)
MDKTININLGGTLFQIDEDAFRILRDYLQAINSRFGNIHGGHETIEDIESRIAEIFQSQKGLAGVVTKENVESMISIIGKPEDFDISGPEMEGPVYTTQKKRMYRNPDDMIIGGVCSGIAAYLDTDSVLIRILFVFALFFGVGFLVYLVLWIAIPKARTESQKRAMYGDSTHYERVRSRKADNTQIQGTQYYNTEYTDHSPVGNAINEIFRAIGKVCYIILRIFLIITGVSLVLTGFLSILCFIMVFLFKYPGAFSIDSTGVNLIYITDFLHYLVNPSAVPWILLLTSVVFILPMLALIYWGVKMIFWFRARDGVVSLVALVVWVGSVAALSIIGFNEGVSFAETGKTSIETFLPKSPDTLYVTTDHKIADLKYDKQLSFGHEAYSVFLNEEKKELYIRPYLSIDRSEDKVTRVEMRKRSTGRTEYEAIKKTEGIQYSYSLRSDSLNIDEYFTIPSGRKWAADQIGIHLYIPTGTVVKFDVPSRVMVHSHFIDDYDDYLESRWESGTGNWIMTQDGLEPVSGNNRKQK